MDETRYDADEDALEGTANKKYTFFVIDGSPAMFETSKEAPECEFLIAVKLILNEMVRVCCSQSLNNHFGVILTSTKNSDTEGLENSTLLVPMGVLGQDEVNSIKDLTEAEDVQAAVEELTGGHQTSDLSNAVNYCKRVFSSCPNTRHQSVIYLTNNRNPFGRDDFWESSYFKRTKTAVTKIIGHGQRKTLGEFSVIMLPQDGYKPENKQDRNKEPWFQLDTEVFNNECDAAARIRQKTTAQRSHANVTVNLGPGVNFDVSVFSMVMEAKPLSHSQKYTHDTEEKLVKTSGYVTKQKKLDVEAGNDLSETADTQEAQEADETQIMLQKCKILQEEAVLDRRELKKSINIGGETIILNREQFDVMSEVETKGLNVVGFVPLDRVDREISIISPKIIQPNDQTTLGSTRIYRALLDRCWARQQAIIAKYQSRKGQKMRIVALVPFKKDMSLIEETPVLGEDGEPMEEDKKPDLLRLEQQRAQADSSEWLHEGFMLIGMPFREEVRDELARFEEHQSAGGAPELEPTQVDVMKKFVKRLTMSYNPSFYENPRLLSERAALCLEATGEELIERKDTLEPYYQIPKRLQRVGTEIEQIVQKFGLEEAMKEKKVVKAKAAPRKRKNEEEDDGPGAKEAKGPRTMTIRECIDAEKMAQFKKDELLNWAVEYCEAPKTLGKKLKGDIAIFIEEFLADNPQVTWNVDVKK